MEIEEFGPWERHLMHRINALFYSPTIHVEDFINRKYILMHVELTQITEVPVPPLSHRIRVRVWLLQLLDLFHH